MSERVDAVVIGAGAVGLAAARAIALCGREVIVLEVADAIGTGTSSRNSEVIHAGIYYPHGSLKARLCVAGRKALYGYCRDRGVDARAVGKLIVATDEEQVPVLRTIRQAAERNGVDDLAWLDKTDVARLEPQVRATAGLHSPQTGIVDSHALMLAYQGDLEAQGGVVAFESPVLEGAVGDDRIRLSIGGNEPMRLEARTVVNAAGLGAPAVARAIGVPSGHVPTAYFAKGNYFSLSGVRAPFRHLIYPVPEQAGLGIHATIDLGGQIRFGPDVEWVDAPDYEVDPARGDRFYDSIRRYWPDLPDGALRADYAGIRPKIVPQGQPAADFVIAGPRQHGCPGLVNLFGIESPGLTASLAIGDAVAVLAEAAGGV